MKANHPVIIQQVQNGFKVSAWMIPGITAVSEDLVFQSFNELMIFLSIHFNFRSSILKSDPPQILDPEGVDQ